MNFILKTPGIKYKTINMEKKILLLLFPIIFIIHSCTNETDLNSFAIGENFISTQSSITLVDTFTIKLSTVLIDSIPTSGPANLLLGEYFDDYLGKSGSTGCFQIDLPVSKDVGKTTVFDSLTLILKMAGINYGDTLQPFTFGVHRITEDIKLTDDYYMYNNSTVKYDETAIGTITFLPKPTLTDSINIRLDDSLGLELLTMMRDNSDEVSTSEKFIKFFKGIALVGATGNNCVIGFAASDSSINMVLHTHTILEEKVELRYKFPIATSGIYYNHFYFDRTGTPVNQLKTQKEEIKSADSNDKSYIQAGSGIVARVDFPGLGKIMEIQKRFNLFKAEIVFKPYPLSNMQVPFPTGLSFYTCDKYNRIISQLLDTEGDAIQADYNFDKVYNEQNYYTLDITSYIKEELSDSYFNDENGLIINFPDNTATGSLERLVLDARETGIYKPVINLYFIFYE
jgi:hypothetical protein